MIPGSCASVDLLYYFIYVLYSMVYMAIKINKLACIQTCISNSRQFQFKNLVSYIFLVILTLEIQVKIRF